MYVCASSRITAQCRRIACDDTCSHAVILGLILATGAAAHTHTAAKLQAMCPYPQQLVIGCHYHNTRLTGWSVWPSGGSIHIQQLASYAESQGLRVAQGKDYCMIWLAPHTWFPDVDDDFVRVYKELRRLAILKADFKTQETSTLLKSPAASDQPHMSAGAPVLDPLSTTAAAADRPILMVAYRYGSVVFFGGDSQQHKALSQSLQVPWPTSKSGT